MNLNCSFLLQAGPLTSAEYTDLCPKDFLSIPPPLFWAHSKLICFLNFETIVTSVMKPWPATKFGSLFLFLDHFNRPKNFYWLSLPTRIETALWRHRYTCGIDCLIKEITRDVVKGSNPSGGDLKVSKDANQKRFRAQKRWCVSS